MHGRLEGRLFTNLVNNEDLPAFMQYIGKPNRKASGLQVESGVELVVSDSIQVRLLDAFAKPVSVHVFHTTFERSDGKSVSVLGFSEMWRPPKRKKSKSSSLAYCGTPPMTPQVSRLLSAPNPWAEAELLPMAFGSAIGDTDASDISLLPSLGLGRRHSEGWTRQRNVLASVQRSYSPRPSDKL